MVLDEKSVEDRMVVVIEKYHVWEDVEGQVDEMGRDERDDSLTMRSVWKRHRVPFERKIRFSLLLHVKPGVESENFLSASFAKTICRNERTEMASLLSVFFVSLQVGIPVETLRAQIALEWSLLCHSLRGGSP